MGLQGRHCGLFGLTSPRTRLTSGHGFSINSGSTYCVRAIPRDSNGNLCSCHRWNPVDATLMTIEAPSCYKFGDKILKPAMRLAGLGSLLISPTIFEEYMSRQPERPSPEAVISESSESAVNIPESEIWGVFFEQAMHAGVRAHYTQRSISRDDLEMQEPYLFIGIPAVALMDTVLRSLHDPECLVFVDRRRVNLQTCPDNFKMMFQLLMETKTNLNSVPKLTSNEESWARQFLLFAGADKEIKCKPSLFMF